MLKGIDISHYQPSGVINASYDFVICKASEGATLKDKSFNAHLDECKKLNIDLVGAYHYAKTCNDVKKDADNFINCIINRKELSEGRLLLALDLEGEDIKRKNAFSWALEWLNLVYNATGVRPVLYISASYTKKCKDIYANNFGLWVAHWCVDKPKIATFPFWALWQYGVKGGLDRDYFNGTKEQYLKYCRKEQIKL